VGESPSSFKPSRVLHASSGSSDTVSFLPSLLLCPTDSIPRTSGQVFEVGSPEFDALLPVGDPRRLPGSRSIVWIDFHKVGTSCGYSVPFFDYKEDR
jgi:hypothetical protein